MQIYNSGLQPTSIHSREIYIVFNDTKIMFRWAPVAHACNSIYLGGRDQEDRDLKPAPGKQFYRPYLEKNPT
jgi:hypothetical protein